MITAVSGQCRVSGVRLARYLPLAWLLPVALGTACATPSPVLRLAPLGKDVVWVGGAATSSRQGKVVRAAAAFAREQGEQVAFRVEVENASDHAVLVDPAKFYYRTCKLRTPPASRDCSTSHFVLDPERVLLALDLQRSRQRAQNSNGEAFWAALVLLNATAAVAGAATHDGHLVTHGLVGGAVATDEMNAKEADERNEAVSYEIERSNWALAALRKTTLAPGKGVAGLVFVPSDAKANEVSLYVQVQNDVLSFPFEQTVYRPKLARARGDVW
jgi:hypothetical protein